MCFLPDIAVKLAKPCLVAAIALTATEACAGNQMKMRRVASADFWGALAELRPDAAARFSRTRSQKLFAESLREMMTGDLELAEKGFGELRATADDSLLRAGARVAYSAALQHGEKWSILSLLAPSVAPASSAVDRAGVELWAASFKSIPAKIFEFPPRTVVLPLQLSGAATPMIPVRIQGRDYHFWLDTGASMTIIASNVAASLGIAPVSPDTLEMVTTTGRVAARPTVIGRLELGRLAVRNVTAMIVDERLMEMRETRLDSRAAVERVKIDGIIGFDVLHRIDIELDYGESRVRLRDPALRRNEDAESRNLFWLGVPVVRLLATDGTPLHFGLDTGAQATFGTETLLDKLRLNPNRSEARRLGGLAGVASLQAPIVHELRVSVRGHPLFLRDLVIYAPVYRTLVSLDGVLGSDLSRAGVIRVDATNGLFSVNEGVRKPTIQD